MEGVKTGQIYRTHQLNPWTWLDACLETSICDFRIRVQIHVIISVWLVVKNQVPSSPNPIQGRHTRLQNILAIYLNIPGNIGSAFQGSTLTVVRLPGASENSTQLVRSGKWKWFCDMFNSWRAKWLIWIIQCWKSRLILPKHRVVCIVYFTPFVDYRIPLSQIKIVLFILANRECLIRRWRCINIIFIFGGQWKARVICGVLILENYPWCVLPLPSKYWKRDRLLE